MNNYSAEVYIQLFLRPGVKSIKARILFYSKYTTYNYHNNIISVLINFCHNDHIQQTDRKYLTAEANSIKQSCISRK